MPHPARSMDKMAASTDSSQALAPQSRLPDQEILSYPTLVGTVAVAAVEGEVEVVVRAAAAVVAAAAAEDAAVWESVEGQAVPLGGGTWPR